MPKFQKNEELRHEESILYVLKKESMELLSSEMLGLFLRMQRNRKMRELNRETRWFLWIIKKLYIRWYNLI